ncbi:hypothetical protein L195_g049226 [Trifolium pratense]|uniref:Uncharacterized protein n=1 Tax=Trifolium pratense TaxID=57577 RepID=A0A2K3JNJ6_TRIPR|nr:hypothetical protein L195_g049226 [Trifolium pratense]
MKTEEARENEKVWSGNEVLGVNVYCHRRYEVAEGITWCYHDIDMKFSPPLVIINLHRGTCGTHKVDSPLPIEFSPCA